MSRTIETHQTSAQPRLPVDHGPFMDFGRWLGRPMGGWAGRLIVSPVAFYFLKIFTTRELSDDDTRTCRLADLDREIRNLLDPRGKYADNDVIVFPRTAISHITVTGKIASKFVIHHEAYQFRVGMFDASAKRQFLLAHGWKLDADLAPTTAPIHGQGLGRPPGYELATPKRGGGMATAAAIIGIIIMVMSLITRIFLAFAHHR